MCRQAKLLLAVGTTWHADALAMTKDVLSPFVDAVLLLLTCVAWPFELVWANFVLLGSLSVDLCLALYFPARSAPSSQALPFIAAGGCVLLFVLRLVQALEVEPFGRRETQNTADWSSRRVTTTTAGDHITSLQSALV